MAGLRFRFYGADSASADLMGEANLAKSDSEFAFGDLRVAWLEAFVLSVDNKKRVAAAAQMKVSEDTVSKHIEKLEKWLGGGPRRLLLWPNMYPPELTDEGTRFLPAARRILELMCEARKPVAVTVAPIKRVSSTAHLTVPPPVATVLDGERDDH
jgi:DNA-binding transcriptional LysR family regulator